MTLRSPITVHLAGLGSEAHVDASDLEFTRSATGGFMSATFKLPEWVDASDPAISPDARCMVDDGRNGRRLFEGFLDLPGKSVGQEGHSWNVGVLGAATVLGDRAVAYVAIDTNLTAFAIRKSTSPGATAASSTLPTNDAITGLLFQFPAGQPIDSTSTITMQYDLNKSGQRVGGFGYSRTAGKIDTNHRLQAYVKPTGGVTVTVRDNPFDTATIGPVTSENPTNFTGSPDIFIIGIKYNGAAANVTSDNVWDMASGLWVRSQLRDLNGAYLTTTGLHARAYVLAHEVVTDSLSSFTNQIDVPGASIDTSFTQQIAQLAYPDPVRMPDVLADMALIEPEMIWEVLESNAAGKHRFRLRKWPTDVRYEADSIDGWDAPGSEFDLSSDVSIQWIDSLGVAQSQTATFSIPALSQWNRRRDLELIDLGSELGGTAAATAIANALAAKMASVPYAGTLTVTRPIRDLYLGRDVMPWEIQPGYLLNVRDIDAPALRLSEVTYRDSDMSASLTLASPTFSLDELLARLARRRTRRQGKPRHVTK